jgi:hypothetical protein
MDAEKRAECGLTCDAVCSCRWLLTLHNNIYHEDGVDTFLQNAGDHLQDYTASQSGSSQSPHSPHLILIEEARNGCNYVLMLNVCI